MSRHAIDLGRLSRRISRAGTQQWRDGRARARELITAELGRLNQPDEAADQQLADTLTNVLADLLKEAPIPADAVSDAQELEPFLAAVMDLVEHLASIGALALHTEPARQRRGSPPHEFLPALARVDEAEG